MVDRFMGIYDVLFDAASKVPIPTHGRELIYDIGQKEGLTGLGDDRNEILSVDREIFREELERLMNHHSELTAFVFFKLVHAAYDKAIGDTHEKKLIFYHIHNPDNYAQLNFVQSSPKADWLIMVREPIQSCESWIRDSFERNEHGAISSKILTMLFKVDNIIYHQRNAIGLRLEDLKESPDKTIPSLCRWMGIQETESLYEMTAQGKKWWGDPSSPDYAEGGMDPFGNTPLRRKIGSIFSADDQFILRTLFYPFSVSFGYTKENLKQFKSDLFD